jgi:hypothetical protein
MRARNGKSKVFAALWIAGLLALGISRTGLPDGDPKDPHPTPTPTSTPSPTPTATPTPTPTPVPDPCDPYPTDCCDQARCEDLTEGHGGGVVCCFGVKHSCAWMGGDGWPLNTHPAAINKGEPGSEIAETCNLEHEDAHHDAVSCPPWWAEGPYRAVTNPEVDVNAEECDAYLIQLDCLAREIENCDSPECEENIRNYYNWYLLYIENSQICGFDPDLPPPL